MKVGLVAGTARKNDGTLPAEKLYAKSPLFRYAVAFCKKTYGNVYILSAQHGLLPLTQEVTSYEANLGNVHGRELKDWYRMVTEQILKVVPPGSELYFHAGNKHRKVIMFLEEKYRCFEPMRSMPIGKQLKFYKERVA